MVNLHRLFVKLSLILVGGFCLPAGAIFATAAGPHGFSPLDGRGGEGGHILGPLPNIDLSKRINSARIPPEPTHIFHHRGIDVVETHEGTFLIGTMEFDSADKAKAFLDERYPNRLP